MNEDNNIERIRELSSVLHDIDNISSIIKTLPICIHEISTDGLVSSMNPAGLEMLGFSEELQVIGSKYMDFVCHKDSHKIQEYWDIALQGTSSKFNFTSTQGDKYSSCFAPIIKNGKVIQIVGFTNNIDNNESW